MAKLECPLRLASNLGGGNTRFDDCEQEHCAWWIASQSACTMAVIGNAALAWWVSNANAAQPRR